MSNRMNFFDQIAAQLTGSEDLDGRYKRSRLYREIQFGFQRPETRDLLRRHARYSERIQQTNDPAEVARLKNDFDAIVRTLKASREEVQD